MKKTLLKTNYCNSVRTARVWGISVPTHFPNPFQLVGGAPFQVAAAKNTGLPLNLDPSLGLWYNPGKSKQQVSGSSSNYPHS